MPDLVFACINCAQAVSKPVQPNALCAIEAIDRRFNRKKPVETRFECVSSPEVFRALFASDVEPPKHYYHQPQASASVLVVPEQSALPNWSTFSLSARLSNVPIPPASSLWILGWTIIYTAGWVVIIKQAVQERQTHAMSPPSPQSFQAPAPTRITSPSATRPFIPGKPTPTVPRLVEWLGTVDEIGLADPDSASPTPDVPSPSTPVPELSKIEVDEVLQVLAADGGIVRPLPGLFLDFNPLPMPLPPTIAPVPIQAPPLDEEIVMMTLTLEGQGKQYAYILLDDGDGMFVLRSNELRLKPQGLEEQGAIEKTVTLRRIDQWGEFLDQSFNFHIQKLPQSAYAA